MINDTKIKNNPSLVKRGGAIINKNDEEYENALKRAKYNQQIQDNIDKTNELEEKIEQIDNKVSEILDFLKEAFKK